MAKSVRDKLRDEVARDFRENDAARMERRAAEAQVRAQRKAAYDARFPDGVMGPDKGKRSTVVDESPVANENSAGRQRWMQETLPRLVTIANEEGPLGLEMLEREMVRMQLAESQRAAVRRQYEAMQDDRRISNEAERAERMRRREVSMASYLTKAAMPSMLNELMERNRRMREFSEKPVADASERTWQQRIDNVDPKVGEVGGPEWSRRSDGSVEFDGRVFQPGRRPSDPSMRGLPPGEMPSIPGRERATARRKALVRGIKNVWAYMSNPNARLNQYGDM